MIPVPPVAEPANFDRDVRQPGNRWLRANRAPKKPIPLWTKVSKELEDGFNRRCGYAAMLDPTGGTVDHHLGIKNYRNLAYEWSNYRHVSSTLNSSKRDADDSVLDPYQVGAGWFEIILPSLQLQMTNRVPAELRAKVEYTLKRLKLRDGERIIRWRKAWYDLYKTGALSLSGLLEVAPLIADAIIRDENVTQ